MDYIHIYSTYIYITCHLWCWQAHIHTQLRQYHRCATHTHKQYKYNRKYAEKQERDERNSQSSFKSCKTMYFMNITKQKKTKKSKIFTEIFIIFKIFMDFMRKKFRLIFDMAEAISRRLKKIFSKFFLSRYGFDVSYRFRMLIAWRPRRSISQKKIRSKVQQKKK